MGSRPEGDRGSSDPYPAWSKSKVIQMRESPGPRMVPSPLQLSSTGRSPSTWKMPCAGEVQIKGNCYYQVVSRLALAWGCTAGQSRNQEVGPEIRQQTLVQLSNFPMQESCVV
jgi:hypothetical protein